MDLTLSTLDWSVIALYFLAIIILVVMTNKKEKKSDDYFLAGRNLGWFAIGASLFASNIGSEHLIGLAGAGAKSGVAVSQFEILAGIILLLLGWVFVPFYLRSGVTTMPEFLELRYSRKARNYLSFISIISYVITKISATIFAGAIVFEGIGLSFWTGAGIVVISTGIYTALGGLKAVIYTDTLQFFIMILGAIFLTFLGLDKLGGVSELNLVIPESFWSMWKSADNPEFPWTGILFGAPILGVWYWCTDQFIVQRVLSAKNISQARRGSIFAGLLKMLPLFLFVIPGIICFALSEKGLITLEKPDHAFPVLASFVLPQGLKGLVVASLLAALMSSLSSVFNSCSTLLTYDFYKVRKPKASEKELMRFGQFSTGVLVLLGILWIPLMKYVSGGLFTYIQSVQAYISPPIASVFLLGLFYKKLNAKGAMASLYTGFVLGVGRLILEINKEHISPFLRQIADINFLHFAFILFAICSFVLVLVSFLTFDPKEKNPHLEKVTYNWSSKFKLSSETKVDFLFSLLLLGVIAILWLVFS